MSQQEINGIILDGDSYCIRKVQLAELANYDWNVYKEWDNVKIMFINLGGDITDVNILGSRLLSKHIYGPLIFIIINDMQIEEIKLSDMPEIIDLSIDVNNDLLYLSKLSETKMETDSDLGSELNYNHNRYENGHENGYENGYENGHDSW